MVLESVTSLNSQEESQRLNTHNFIPWFMVFKYQIWSWRIFPNEDEIGQFLAEISSSQWSQPNSSSSWVWIDLITGKNHIRGICAIILEIEEPVKLLMHLPRKLIFGMQPYYDPTGKYEVKIRFQSFLTCFT